MKWCFSKTGMWRNGTTSNPWRCKFSDVLQWWDVNDWSCSLQKMLRFLHAQWIFWILKINSQPFCSCDLQKLNHPVGTVGFLFLHWSQKSSTCGPERFMSVKSIKRESLLPSAGESLHGEQCRKSISKQARSTVAAAARSSKFTALQYLE